EQQRLERNGTGHRHPEVIVVEPGGEYASVHHVRRHERHLWQLIGDGEFVWLGGCAHWRLLTVDDLNPGMLKCPGLRAAYALRERGKSPSRAHLL
nr:hypothetical protein [Tanacetum cinerariifolium]